MHSRPNGKQEEWFPTQAGDWVVLDDGTYGRIGYQSPSSVQVILHGGSQVLIPTLKFMGMNPRVLSSGFRVESRFGIDYRHQALANDVIPARMLEHLQAVFADRLGEHLPKIQVELAAAGSSSLDFVVLLDCPGDIAEHWTHLPRWVQAALVDLCTREGWIIPFPQLRLHTAKP